MWWPLTLAVLALQHAAAPGLLLQTPDEPAEDPPDELRKVKVLVFGDSWGAMGPSWQMLRDMFQRHKIYAKVVSTAVSGTTSCQWAQKEYNLAKAAKTSFGEKGPDFVWLTLGGNDLLLPNYLACTAISRSENQAKNCAIYAARRARHCNKKLLLGLYEVFPATQVVQCGYDFQCAGGACIPFTRWPFCAKNVTCANLFAIAWGTELVEPLVEELGVDRFAGISVTGSCQKAGNIPDAEIGEPNMDEGSPCKHMVGCEHPAPNSKAAWLIGEGFWDLFFKERLAHLPDHPPSEPEEFPDNPNWEHQFDTTPEDVACNYDWKPDLEHGFFEPPPCNRSAAEYLPLLG